MGDGKDKEAPTRRRLTFRRRAADRCLAAAALPADAAPPTTASRRSVVSPAQISSLLLLVASAGLGVAAACWGLGSPSLIPISTYLGYIASSLIPIAAAPRRSSPSSPETEEKSKTV
ncbi:hypothetical protein GUJ93_ZPchr0007g3826 [Zizania palustris]|uniref:Uncharacterized protein n=1 Tax=Zizania palustris TaxID=103762 RepID=A0A8J5T674_ZIZPA|nr:hypothetical protein GUJ93_ZPchr0007g3826 [Zizania palustris]